VDQPGDDALSAAAAAAAINGDGWRLLLGAAHSSVAVTSMPAAVEVAAAAVRACGPDSGQLSLDLRPDRVELVLGGDPAADRLSRLNATLAARISAAVRALGLATRPGESGRGVQALEIAIDALDIPAVLPFWQAVLGYACLTRPIAGGEETVVVDPFGQAPTVWFQQLDTPRPQRNRVHFDLTLAEDEADARIASALAAGGRLVSAAHARAFWVLADPEGNEVCICTWQDRD